jgi:hypothetical protein
MASLSSTITNPLLGHVVVEKLSKNNHLLWKAQVVSVVRGARLEGYLTGSTKMSDEFLITHEGDEVRTPNSAHENWVAMDQQVSTYKTAIVTWSKIERSFSSLTRVCAVNTCMALTTTQKGNISVTEYVNKLRALGDEIASSGKPLDDKDMVS